jgi:divalent metal cation (Fe/Co/Zn/Cd) transporter
MSERGFRGPRRDWAQIGLRLVAATLAYNVLEAVIALWAGAEAASIALLGFGLDSLIECAAAGVLLWRLSLETRGVDAHELERAEQRVHRFVGGTFLALAGYVTLQSFSTLWRQDAPQESWMGIALAAASLVIMPLISWGKLRAAREIASAALRAEAKETLACSYLSFALLLGLAANATLGWWWADPVAAFAMVPWLVREGLEGIRREACEDS